MLYCILNSHRLTIHIFQELVLVLSIADAYGCGKQPTMVPTNGCPAVRCSTTDLPICASNGGTYRNKCYLDAAICEAKQNGSYLEMSHYGACLPACYSCQSSVYDNVGLPAIPDPSKDIRCQKRKLIYSNEIRCKNFT